MNDKKIRPGRYPAAIATSLLFLLLVLAGCQKVIDLKLNNASGKYVIEGNVTDLAGPYTVTIGQTGSVTSEYSFNGVSQAAVVIRDNAGNSETLQEKSPGVYQTAVLSGVEGRTYYLSISLGGQRFTSSSVMPYRVNLDSIYVASVMNFDKSVRAVVPVFKDPPETGNSYRINQTIDGVLDKTLYYENDDFINGRTNSMALLRPDPDSTLHTGDRVDIEMQCIDPAVYQYWFSLDESSLGNNNSNLPANPVTNIQGGALGYFSAHTSQTKTLVVK
ncbi:MAG TPA: DUF4249 domain-containing protein [Puia sp.]|jgi:hypothetical protein